MSKRTCKKPFVFSHALFMFAEKNYYKSCYKMQKSYCNRQGNMLKFNLVVYYKFLVRRVFSASQRPKGGKIFDEQV